MPPAPWHRSWEETDIQSRIGYNDLAPTTLAMGSAASPRLPLMLRSPRVGGMAAEKIDLQIRDSTGRCIA